MELEKQDTPEFLSPSSEHILLHMFAHVMLHNICFLGSHYVSIWCPIIILSSNYRHFLCSGEPRDYVRRLPDKSFRVFREALFRPLPWQRVTNPGLVTNSFFFILLKAKISTKWLLALWCYQCLSLRFLLATANWSPAEQQELHRSVVNCAGTQ